MSRKENSTEQSILIANWFSEENELKNTSTHEDAEAFKVALNTIELSSE